MKKDFQKEKKKAKANILKEKKTQHHIEKGTSIWNGRSRHRQSQFTFQQRIFFGNRIGSMR